MTRPKIGDQVRVKPGYVDDTGGDIRPGYGGEIVAMHGNIAEVDIVGLHSAAQFTGPQPAPIHLGWLDVVDNEDDPRER